MAVLIVVGLARSGKDSVADYLAERHGFSKYVLSDVLAEELERRNEIASKENMNLLGDELRAKHGMAVIAERLLKKIREKGNLAIVGPRSIEEILAIRKKFPEAKIIEVRAAPEKRFERRSPLDPVEEKKFFERDSNDLEKKGLRKVLNKKDFLIENRGDLKGLHLKIESLVQNI
ncbi:MAG: AAA family ATPase [Candidatus Diapherotrites archaeon]|uniref:AAA family ATPase n=1 Tax=Candidatus Iainarchaeum sp. TaxID=3101447 RepID=A0A7J4IZT3_9ARCH|nr:MAG: hypothetical protein QT03_C0001G0159 [archaeon GW2011_AR10]MBS3059759.1 AAA family ATPase [Candidatus Diapherotrites archaeon]HIH08486.1 AAA family ATPase [Candidatus Diapherotrites archaeon]